MCIASLAEVISIGAVIPFLGALTSPDWVLSHPVGQALFSYFGIREHDQLLLPLTVLFVVAALLSGGCRLALHWGQTKLSYAVGGDLSISIFERTLYQPYSVHINRNSSEVIAVVSSKADGVVSSVLIPILVMLSSTLILAATFLTLVSIEPVIAVSAIAGFGSIYGVTIGMTRARLSAFGESMSREQTHRVKTLQEALGGIREVLIDGSQEVYCDTYRRADARLRRAQSSVTIIGNSPRYIVETIGMVMIAVLAYWLTSGQRTSEAAIPVLGALALGAQRMLPVLQQGFSNWSTLRSAQAALSDTLLLLEQPAPTSAQSSSPAPLKFEREIRLECIDYKYGKDQVWILNHVSLSIPKGSCIGFVGSTGGGKSTLLDIVMGLLNPVSGALKIDGVPISSENSRGWQAHIAHVPQSIFLSDATIAENIAFGVPVDEISLDRVRHAAQLAQVASTVEAWPAGYNTRVGERGVRLSGGQRQRIGIARALYKNVDVIVFDEATSALDSATEEAVMRSISGLDQGLTVLMVAHRLTTLRNCTHVVELAGGAIQRVGSYAEIIGAPDKKS
jgi:ATP-binding cassette, subfamily B, bacterial PglK